MVAAGQKQVAAAKFNSVVAYLQVVAGQTLAVAVKTGIGSDILFGSSLFSSGSRENFSSSRSKTGSGGDILFGSSLFTSGSGPFRSNNGVFISSSDIY